MMKEYNWRNERKKYLNADTQQPAASQPPLPPPPQKKKRSIWLRVLGITGIIIIALILLLNSMSCIFNFDLKNAVRIIVPVNVTGIEQKPVEPSAPPSKTPPKPETVPASPSTPPKSPVKQEPQATYKASNAEMSLYSHPQYGGFSNVFQYNAAEQKYALVKNVMHVNNLISSEQIRSNDDFSQFQKKMNNTYNFFIKNFGFKSYDGSNAKINCFLKWTLCYINGPLNNKYKYYLNSMACSSMQKNGKYFCFFVFGENNPNTITHEYMHGVTMSFVTNGKEFMIYAGEPGAINESLSDIFSCLHAIDENPNMPAKDRWVYCNGSRNLKNPHSIVNILDGKKWRMPEYYKEAGCWYNGMDDNSGVHHNMSVLGKMAYLLSDGGTFRGETIKAMGHKKVQALFWQLVSSGKLTVNQSFKNLAHLFLLSAGEIKFSDEEKRNVLAACRAINLPSVPQLKSSNMMFPNFSNGITLSAETAMFDNKNYFSNQTIKDINAFRNSFANYELSDIRSSSNFSGNTFAAAQEVSGLPVFASSVIVQTGNDDKISFVSQNFSNNFTGQKYVPRKFSEEQRQLVKKLQPGAQIMDQESMLFDPSLLDRQGDAVVVWKVKTTMGTMPHHCYLINQQNNQIVFDYPLNTAH